MDQPLVRRSLLAAGIVAATTARAAAQPIDGPVKVIDRYAAALANNNVEALVALYTDNGVFMRPDLPAAVGQAALRQAYKEVFAALKVDLKFTVHGVEVVGEIAWLRGTSAGRVKTLATGVETADTYHQLLVFRRERGGWKIRSYLYAPANAATSAKT